MNTSEKLNTVAANVERVYAAGAAREEKRCTERHYAATVTGNGADTLSVQLPFEPDALYLYTNEPSVRLTPNQVAYVEIDFAALGQLAGKMGGTWGRVDTSTYVNQLCVPNTAAKLYKRAEDGIATIGPVNITISDLGACVFADGVEYVILASKTQRNSLKDRIEESVALLPNRACTAFYQTEKVQAAMTDEEWTALMATKPKCTFSMV